LDWSPDGALLASGGNDNVLCVWDAARLSGGPGPERGGGGGGGGSGAMGWSSDEEGGGGEGGRRGGPVPLFRFSKEANGGHCAAVKALAWCPHRAGLLASGGGTADKCIRFWNTATGHLTGAVDTGSQVCQLAWSPSSMELLSAHGYSTNTLVLWRFPSMSRVVTLTGHTFRVLYMTVAPDGESVCTGAGDETIRFWK
jgi:WD40 repeat protein